MCHAEWDWVNGLQDSWDLESWRADLSWTQVRTRVLSHHCNWASDGQVIRLDASKMPDMRVAAEKGKRAVLKPSADAGSHPFVADFRLVLGLAGSGYSLQWANGSNGSDHYLRHQNGRLILQLLERCGTNCGPSPDSPHAAALFAADATFYLEYDLSGRFAFRSYNYPDHYARHFSGT